jgi:glycosyltransferase 2 family protein
MRLARRQPPEDPSGVPSQAYTGSPASQSSANQSSISEAPGAGLAATVTVEDQLEPRIRLPADLLRCVTACIEIVLLAILGQVGPRTASAVQFDVVHASERLVKGLIAPLHSIAFVALIVLPIALAVSLVVIDQVRRLSEAVVVGLIAGGVAAAVNGILQLSSFASLYHALARSGGPAGAAALDPYLTGLAAYLTVIGLSGRPRWRTWFWLAIGFYCVTSLVQLNASTLLSLLIALLMGAAVGSGLRYLIGTNSERPTASEIAAALSATLAPVVAIRRIFDNRSENRRYAARRKDGKLLDVTVFDRDQQAADWLYRIYRRLRVTSQVSRSAPLTVNRAVERRALMAYAVEDAGVPTPRLQAALRVGPEAAVIATSHHDGTTLADLPGEPADEQLSLVWDVVLKLHARRVTHRSLTADHVLLTGDGYSEVMLLDPGDGDVAASDLQLRLDLAQLTATIALLVGPERSARLATRKLGQAEVARLVPLLQPVVLHRSTRAALRRHQQVLPALRRRFMGTGPADGVPPVQLERVRLRSVLTLVASVFAAYIVIGQLNRVSFGRVLRESDWRWLLVGLALSAVTYVAAVWSLSGFVLERLSFFRTFLAQLAGKFVTLVTPAAVGVVALNIRYLNKAKVAPADAAASVGVSQVLAFALHIVMLIIFAAITGASTSHTSFHPPGWAFIALAVLGAAILVVFAFPAGRRLVRSRVAPALGQVIPRLLDIAQQPGKLAEGIGGQVLLTLAYILCLDASVRAVGSHASFFPLAVVYLTGSALGSLVPTPGGIGAVELALSGGLSTIAHVPLAYATSAVLLFRLLTFWLPIPLGWAAFHYLQRKDAL